jgi:16S rRNA processing protein RimM
MTTRSTEWATLALIRRPQGRRGEVFADLLTDFPEKFSDRKRLWLIADERSSGQVPPPRKVSLSAHWLHKGGVVLHFEGVDSISAAEELKGLIAAVPFAERAPLGEDEAYIADLVGCTLIEVGGPEQFTVGIVDDVDRSAGPVALLVVLREGKEILIPFAKDYLRKIDLDAKRIEMALPEGLVDLNA